MFLALLKRALAITCALLTIALTAGLSPQTVARHQMLAEPPPTPGPDDGAIATELARIHARAGMDPGGPDATSGGLIHVVGAGETLQVIAIEYHVNMTDILDANDLRRPGQVLDRIATPHSGRQAAEHGADGRRRQDHVQSLRGQQFPSRLVHLVRGAAAGRAVAW